MITLATDHAPDCAALGDYRVECNCGVGIETVTLPVAELVVICVSMSRLIKDMGLTKSSTQASQLIQDRAVEIIDGAGRRTAGFSEWVPTHFTLRVGRQWRKVILT
jgi:hypothetical protein